MTDGDWVESKDQDPNGEVRLIQLADIGEFKFLDKSSRYLTGEKFVELRCTELQENDVLIARMPDPLGRACVYPSFPNRAVTVVDVCVWRKGEAGADPHWVAAMINAPQTRSWIARHSSGTTRKRISTGNLKKYNFPLPPLAEQKRIVEKLDSLATASTEARTALTRVEALVERYKEAAIARALFTPTGQWRSDGDEVWCADLQKDRDDFKSGLRGSRLHSDAGLSFGDLPEGAPHWGRVYLGQVIEFTSGFAFKSSWYASKGRKLLRGANVAPGKIDWGDCKHLSEDQASGYQNLQIKIDDIVLAMDRPLISSGLKVAKVDRESDGALLVQRVARIRAKADVLQSYIWHILNSHIFLRHAIGRATGMDLPHISSNDIQTTPILLPTIDEQREIVDRIENAFAQIDTLAAAAKSARERLDKLDRAVLAKAFRGELAPQDPNDEPASELLKRLQKESA